MPKQKRTERKSLVPKVLSTAGKPDLRPANDPRADNSRCIVALVPDPAKREHAGPIWDRDGHVLVDRERFPTLHRCAETGGQVIAAMRAKWGAIEEASRHGHYDEADRLRSSLLTNVSVDARPMVRTEDLPADTADLVERLRKATDKSTARKLRAEMRARGIKGGLRGLRG